MRKASEHLLHQPGAVVCIQQIDRHAASQGPIGTAQPDTRLLGVPKNFLGRKRHPCDSGEAVRLFTGKCLPVGTPMSECSARHHQPLDFSGREAQFLGSRVNGSRRQSRLDSPYPIEF